MIFGVGSVPQESKSKTCVFRLLPSNILGFHKVQQQVVSDRMRGMRQNADLKGALKTKSPDSEDSEDENETPEHPQNANARQSSQMSSTAGTQVSFAKTNQISSKDPFSPASSFTRTSESVMQ